jgi:hypothetical protein
MTHRPTVVNHLKKMALKEFGFSASGRRDISFLTAIYKVYTTIYLKENVLVF